MYTYMYAGTYVHMCTHACMHASICMYACVRMQVSTLCMYPRMSYACVCMHKLSPPPYTHDTGSRT